MSDADLLGVAMGALLLVLGIVYAILRHRITDDGDE